MYELLRKRNGISLPLNLIHPEKADRLTVEMVESVRAGEMRAWQLSGFDSPSADAAEAVRCAVEHVKSRGEEGVAEAKRLKDSKKNPKALENAMPLLVPPVVSDRFLKDVKYVAEGRATKKGVSSKEPLCYFSDIPTDQPIVETALRSIGIADAVLDGALFSLIETNVFWAVYKIDDVFNVRDKDTANAAIRRARRAQLQRTRTRTPARTDADSGGDTVTSSDSESDSDTCTDHVKPKAMFDLPAGGYQTGRKGVETVREWLRAAPFDAQPQATNWFGPGTHRTRPRRSRRAHNTPHPHSYCVVCSRLCMRMRMRRCVFVYRLSLQMRQLRARCTLHVRGCRIPFRFRFCFFRLHLRRCSVKREIRRER